MRKMENPLIVGNIDTCSLYKVLDRNIDIGDCLIYKVDLADIFADEIQLIIEAGFNDDTSFLVKPLIHIL